MKWFFEGFGKGIVNKGKFVFLFFRVNVFFVYFFDCIFIVLIGEFEDLESNVFCEL